MKPKFQQSTKPTFPVKFSADTFAELKLTLCFSPQAGVGGNVVLLPGNNNSGTVFIQNMDLRKLVDVSPHLEI